MQIGISQHLNIMILMSAPQDATFVTSHPTKQYPQFPLLTPRCRYQLHSRPDCAF